MQMKKRLLSGKKSLFSSKIAREVKRAAAFLLSVVLLATSVSLDALAAENDGQATETESYYGTRTWKFNGTEMSDAIEGTYTDTTHRKDSFEWAGLTIDATASGNGVYYNEGSKCTQFEPTVTVKIPAAGDYELSLTGYGWSGATVQVDGGTAQSISGDQTLTFTGTVGDAGYITLVTASNGVWVHDITVTCTEAEEPVSYLGTRTWKFNGTEMSDAIEGTYTDETHRKDAFEWAGLTIDATASGNGVYYNSGSKCTQFEPTVTVKIPAEGDYELSFTGYGWSGATVQVDGGTAQSISGDQTLTFTGTVGDAGYITLVTASNGVWAHDLTVTCTEADDSGNTGNGGNEGGSETPVDPSETNGFIQTTPYEGVTYEFDLTNPNAPVYGGDTAVEKTTPIVSTGLFTVHSPAKYWNDHGTSGGMVVEIKVAGNSRISLLGCAYSGDQSVVATTETGALDKTSQAITLGCKTPTDFLYVGEAGSVKLTVSGGYTHGFLVTPLADDEVPDLDVEVEVDPLEPDAFKATTPNRDVTYVLNFMDTISPVWDFQNGDVVATEDNRPYMKTGTTGLVTVNTAAKYWNSHGTNGAMDIDIAVSGDCKITISGCQYTGDADTYTLSSTTGTIEPADAQQAQTKTDGGEINFYYTGDAGTVKMVGTGGYTHKVTITPIIGADEIFNEMLEAYDPDRKIDVWDFGGNLESDTDKYTNYIEKSFWDAIEAADFQDNALGRFRSNGEYEFGDLVMRYQASDRLYYNNEDGSAAGKNSCDYNKYRYTFEDGYSSNGAYYAAGQGQNDGKDTRSLLLTNVYAGDVINAYVFLNNSAMDLHCLYLGEDGAQDEVLPVALETYTQGTFTAEYNGNYLLYFNNGAGKPRYMRVTRTPGVLISGTVDVGNYDLGDDFSIVLQDNETGKNFNAYMQNDGSFKAFAPANANLTAVLKGALGYGFTDESKVVKTGDSALDGVALVVGEKDLITLSGKVVGIADDYDISTLKLVLACTDASLLKDSAVIEVADDWSYSVMLEKGIEYALTMTGCNDYELDGAFVVKSNADVQKNIQIKAKTLYDVKGSFIGLAEGAAPASITFTNLEDKYVYTGTVSATGYTAKLRDGEYQVAAAVDGYNMVAHVVVAGGAVTKDIMYVSKASATALPFVADIYVGCPDQENNYATIREAVKAIEGMRLSNATDRITVHIAPGLYREQIQLKSPNVSFVNTNPEEEVKITFYYGIGYEYYSTSDKNNKGYYSEAAAFDQYLKAPADRWGSTVRIYSQATDFYAENITFENSFTKYITEEEIADGVSPETNLPDRTAADAVASARAYNERSAALAVEGDRAEFYNCEILGGQDTLYTGSVRGYFHNCFIEGNTDYIFGSGEMIFENCELQFYGYSDTTSGPVLTAATATQKYGYIFRNCYISQNPDWAVATGSFGRPWGQAAMVYILNCKLQHADVISAAGWGNMSNNTAEKANFNEFNTTLVNGEKADTSKRVTGVITTNPYATGDDIINKAFSGWTPSTFAMDTDNVALAEELKVTKTTTGDLAVGDVLTAEFSLGSNEAANSSVIQWYRVTADGEVLVKASVAYVDRTYTVAEDDLGAQIKVVVNPETVSGYTAEAVSLTTIAVGEDSGDDSGNTGDGGNTGDDSGNTGDDSGNTGDDEPTEENATAGDEAVKDIVDVDKITVKGDEDVLAGASMTVASSDATVESANYTNMVALSFNFVDANNSAVSLASPVTVTMPVPTAENGAAIASDKLVILQYNAADDTYTALKSGEDFIVNADGTVTLTVSSAATLLFAEAVATSGGGESGSGSEGGSSSDNGNDSDSDDTASESGSTAASSSPKTGDMNADFMTFATVVIVMVFGLMMVLLYMSQKKSDF